MCEFNIKNFIIFKTTERSRRTLMKCYKVDGKNQEFLTIGMIQNKQKLFLHTITNAFVRDWIMLEKTPLHPLIQDDLD